MTQAYPTILVIWIYITYSSWRPQCGVHTNLNALFGHMLPEVYDWSENSKFHFKWRVNLKSEKRTDQEVSQVMSWNTLEIEITSASKGCKLYFGDSFCWCHDLITWAIKFLGDKPLYHLVPDPFPRCGMGPGHVRLWSVLVCSIFTFTKLDWCLVNTRSSNVYWYTTASIKILAKLTLAWTTDPSIRGYRVQTTCIENLQLLPSTSAMSLILVTTCRVLLWVWDLDTSVCMYMYARTRGLTSGFSPTTSCFAGITYKKTMKNLTA